MSILPRLNISLEKALKDLEEYEKRFRLSNENLKQQKAEIEKLRYEKQHLISTAESYKEKVRDSQEKLMVTKNGIEDTLLKIHKAEVADLYNKQKIKQFQQQIKTKTAHFDAFDIKIISPVKYVKDKEDLLRQKEMLEGAIHRNNMKMKDIEVDRTRI